VKVATLSIGDELLLGEIVDSNAAHIARHLYMHGIKVHRQLTVGDQERDIGEAVLSLAGTSDAVVVTGGLGPTFDDITARAVAIATGRRLILNEEALAHVRKVGGKLGRGVHPLNEKQAILPANALLIPNPAGTACGFHLVHDGCSIFFMPGVPDEMERMLEQTVIPCIEKMRNERGVLATKVLKVFGLSEAEVDGALDKSMPAGSGVTIAFSVDFPEVHVKLRAAGGSAREVGEALDAAGGKVREILQGYVFGEDGETIDSVVSELFRRKGVTLSLAESCTGGLVAKRITDVPGSSAYFVEGAVTYADASKIRTLGVSPRLIEEQGAVSSTTAMAMGRGMRKLSGSVFASAIRPAGGPTTHMRSVRIGLILKASSGGGLCRMAMSMRLSSSHSCSELVTPSRMCSVVCGHAF